MPNYRFIDKVSAAANLTAEALAVGADGAKGVKALALGAANLKLFMNAAGTANEYASGIKIGTFTHDVSTTTGDKAITGVGFKPSAIIFVGTLAGYGTMIGFDDATTRLATLTYGTTPTYNVNTSYSLWISDGTNTVTGVVKSLDSDGFTLTITKANSPTGTATFGYLAFR